MSNNRDQESFELDGSLDDGALDILISHGLDTYVRSECEVMKESRLCAETQSQAAQAADVAAFESDLDGRRPTVVAAFRAIMVDIVLSRFR